MDSLLFSGGDLANLIGVLKIMRTRQFFEALFLPFILAKSPPENNKLSIKYKQTKLP
jgi:hypothetical protein